MLCASLHLHTIFYTLPQTIFHTSSFTHNFVTRSLSHTHTTFTQAIFHTQLCHTHTPSFFVTRHLSHTTLSHTHTPSFFVTHQLSHATLSYTTSTTSFVFPSFPVPATTFLAYYWKKLTRGVIRSFNYWTFKQP